MKTSIDIERDFYTVIKASPLAAAIKGSVLRAEEREDDATTEDLTIHFLTGSDHQIQRGVVIVNIYVPDIRNGEGKLLADKPRIGELMNAMKDIRTCFHGTGYLVNGEDDSNETPYYEKIEGLKQHCIILRLYFRILSN